MSEPLQHLVTDGNAAEMRFGDVTLFRYLFRPETPADESPRPYAHPVRSLSGESLTNFRPNDHRWHHGMSFTITSISGHNFWGGVTYRREDGYQWRADHGSQRHVAWRELSPQGIAHAIEWTSGEGELLLDEERRIGFEILSKVAWRLRWSASLTNRTDRMLSLGHYHSSQGLDGSHYSGLQFRGSRELLDDHGDAAIGVCSEDGREGESAVHGAESRWMEWRCQKDVSQRRVTIRFENNTGPMRCFVRRAMPLAAIPFQFENDLQLESGATFNVDHSVTITDS